MKIPDNVKTIIETLEEKGFEAYAVGGCVRDSLLGRTPGDWDITTSARPEQVKVLFPRTIDTGIAHGTVTIMIGKEGYEITTYRTESDYQDHRHPDKVEFTPNLAEDLKRRDFTINAMAFNEKKGIVDLFHGMDDLQKKWIRCVGDPVERFDEDALRMLRGVRFAGQLQFQMDEATRAAIVQKADTLVNVSAERICTELTKLLMSDGADRLLLAVDTGLTPYFLPELDRMFGTPQQNPHHCYDVGHHSVEAVRQINRLWKERELGLHFSHKEHVALVYGALLHDVAKPDCKTTDEQGIDHFYGHDEQGAKKAGKILKRLKFDNDTISKVTRMIAFHDRRHEGCYEAGHYSPKGKKAMRRLINQAGSDVMPLLFLLQEADLCAQSEYHQQEKIDKLAAGRRCYEEIVRAGDAVTVKDLAIGGRELMELGVRKGPEIGEILGKLLDLVMEDPTQNTREELQEQVCEFLRNGE